jgi:hypothetical protein
MTCEIRKTATTARSVDRADQRDTPTPERRQTLPSPKKEIDVVPELVDVGDVGDETS